MGAESRTGAGPRAAGVQAPVSARRAGGGLVMRWAVVGWLGVREGRGVLDF